MLKKIKNKKGNGVLEFLSIATVVVIIIISCFGGFSNSTKKVVDCIGRSYISTDTCVFN